MLAGQVALFASGLVLASSSAAAYSPQLQLYHRVLVPAGPDEPYTPRGTLSAADNALTFVPSSSFSDDLTAFAAKITQTSGALYQVALATGADSSQEDWDFTSVKACYLATTTSEIITLHLTPVHEIYGFNYHVYPVAKDGSCPPPSSRPNNVGMNTSVILSNPSPAPAAQLRIPPPLSAEGKPITPVPEKSFIQKYWIYIVPVLVIFLIAGPADDEEGQTGGNAGAARRK